MEESRNILESKKGLSLVDDLAGSKSNTNFTNGTASSYE